MTQRTAKQVYELQDIRTSSEGCWVTRFALRRLSAIGMGVVITKSSWGEGLPLTPSQALRLAVDIEADLRSSFVIAMGG